jgi:hypothetical protein
MIEQGKDTERLFTIERFAAGYFAIRDASPRFAIAAPSAGEAAELAIKALAIAGETRRAETGNTDSAETASTRAEGGGAQPPSGDS